MSALLTSSTPAGERAKVDFALQGAGLGRRLADRFGLDATTSHVLDAKYEPGSSCTVLHQLGPAMVTAVLSLHDDHAGDHAHEGAQGGVVIAPGVRAYRFPDDPALGGLALAMDPGWLGRRLTDARGAELHVSRVTLVRYRPAKRATLRVEGWERTATGSRSRRLYFVKIYHRAGKAEAVFEEATRLGPWAQEQVGLLLAPAVALLPDVPAVVQAAVSGRPLDDLLRAGDQTSSAAAAGALAVLHSAPPVSRRARSIDAELARFGRRAAAVERVSPAVGRGLGDLAEALVGTRPPPVTDRSGLVHGDCKPSQFLVGPTGVALIDLDHCGLADPASDVGTFLATLRQRAIRGSMPTAAAGEGRFLEAYASTAGVDASFAAAAQWYEAVALCRKALRAFARSPRSPLAPALATEGRSLLDLRKWKR